MMRPVRPTIFWTSGEFAVEMRHAGEREGRTSFSDVLRSHRAGTARSPKGHCGDEGQPVRSQTTLRACEGSSGECAILSARAETQPVSSTVGVGGGHPQEQPEEKRGTGQTSRITRDCWASGLGHQLRFVASSGRQDIGDK